MDPILLSQLQNCDRGLLRQDINNLNIGIFNEVVKRTKANWETFLIHLQDRGTFSDADIDECNLTNNESENMRSILRRLGGMGKRVINLIIYLYATRNYRALECFGIHIEAPPPPDDPPPLVNEIDDRRQQPSFPPAFKAQPPKNLKVYNGMSIKFEPCYAKRAKRYQWFKVVPGGQLLVGEVENNKYGTFEKPNAELADEGIYFCKAHNDAGPATSRNIKVQIFDSQRPQDQPRGPVMRRQPTSFQGVEGDEALFICNAVGAEPLTYQWYSSRGALDGETRPELRLRVHVRCEGTYFCVITDAHGDTVVSDEARLHLGAVANPQTKFTASSKVALLIGNGTYKPSHNDLHAVYFDIPRLAYLLNQMGFKVVTLYDLTVTEMKNAVTYFASLMMEGVYAFAYFAGHGYYYQGQNYLLAQDARILAQPEQDAISIEWILDELQKKTPALKTICVDCCRKLPTFNIEVEPTEINPNINSDNTVILYATGDYGTGYDEVNSEDSHSFFAHCLLEAMAKKEPVEYIGFRLKQIMRQMYLGDKVQYPEIRTSLAEPRSLWDDTDSSGKTTKYNANMLQWEFANRLPQSRCLSVERNNLMIQLDFEAYATNLFSIVVTLQQPNATDVPFLAYIADRPIPQGVTAERRNVPEVGMKRTETIFRNVQKLQDELKVHLILESLHTHKVILDHVCNFEWPMVSVIGLWKAEAVFSAELQSMELRHHEQARQERRAARN